MKIDSVTLSNFRGYKNETTILFNDLTVFVDKNNARKSTVLEALDLFFNDGKGVIKCDKTDINIDEYFRASPDSSCPDTETEKLVSAPDAGSGVVGVLRMRAVSDRAGVRGCE